MLLRLTSAILDRRVRLVLLPRRCRQLVIMTDDDGDNDEVDGDYVDDGDGNVVEDDDVDIDND